MITCQDILELQLDGVELIAGEKGLTRPVTWTYMVQTRPFAEHMNQGNFALCVVDYVRFDLAEAQKVMEELYGLGISGFGISITDDREPVPKEMIDKANELKLPLFYIRWEGASFVDIAQSVGKIILEYEMQNKRMGDYLYNLLFGYDINDRYIEKISQQFGINFTTPCRVGIIVADRKYGINLEQDEHIYEYYANYLNQEVMEMEGKPMFLRFLNKFVLLFEAKKDKSIEHELEKVLQKIDASLQFHGTIRSTCILGGIYTNPADQIPLDGAGQNSQPTGNTGTYEGAHAGSVSNTSTFGTRSNLNSTDTFRTPPIENNTPDETAAPVSTYRGSHEASSPEEARNLGDTPFRSSRAAAPEQKPAAPAVPKTREDKIANASVDELLAMIEDEKKKL